MLVWIIEKGHGKIVPLKGDRCHVSVFDRLITFIYHHERYYLRLPNGIKYFHREEIMHEATIILDDELNKERSVLCFSEYDSGYSKFKKYAIPENTIFIGSSETDEISVRDIHAEAGQIRYDSKKRWITVCNNNGIAALNGTVFTSERVLSGDRLQICNLQVVFFEYFLMINCCENISVNLPLFQTKQCDPLAEQTFVDINRHFRNPTLTSSLNIELDEPLQVDQSKKRSLFLHIGPTLTMSLASLSVGILSAYNGYHHGREIVDVLPMLVLPAVMVISTLVWNPLNHLMEKIRIQKESRKRLKDYTVYLQAVQQDIIDFEDNYVTTLENCIPLDFGTSCVPYEMIYQKTPEHDDWLLLRLGTGIMEFNIGFHKNFHLRKGDPVTDMIQTVKNTYSSRENISLCISLIKYRCITIYGTDCEDYLLYLLYQICAFHGYDILSIVFLTDTNWVNHNNWIFRIRHIKNVSQLIVTDVHEWIRLKSEFEQKNNTVIYIVQNEELLPIVKDENIVLFVSESGYVPTFSEAQIFVNDHIGVFTEDHRSFSFTYDLKNQVPPWEFFDYLFQYRLKQSKEFIFSNTVSFDQLYEEGYIDESFILHCWNTSRTVDSIRARIGVGETGEVFTIDLHEKVNGPHMLIAGTTGSGKSELITTMILSLIIEYSCKELQISIIDFKGGGVSQVFSSPKYCIPHITGVFSNLEEEMDRALVAFRNEILRREKLFQELADKIGKPVLNLSVYQENDPESCALPYLSSLLIIVDEFAELKMEHPDFMQDLISVSRVGRSLGIHLILATQKPAGVINDQILSNSRLKICLKVQDRQDSYEVLHDNCAANLHFPGEAYVLCDGILSKVKTAYCGESRNADNPEVQILSMTGNVTYTNRMRSERGITQVSRILKSIRKAEKNFEYHAQKLWMDPIIRADISDIESFDQLWIGKVDDFYRNQQYLFSLSQSSLVVTFDRQEREYFIKTLLWTIFMRSDSKDEVFIIDDAGFEFMKNLECNILCGNISSNEIRSVRLLFAHLNEKVDIRRILIITDYVMFINTCDEHREYLHELLETLSNSNNIEVILLSSMASSVPYRDLFMIQTKISLRNENEQDLGVLFERAVHRTIQTKKHGLICNDQILEITLFDITEEMLIQACRKHKGEERNYCIPTIPDYVSRMDYSGNNIPLGRNIDSCDWLELMDHHNLVVLATYEDELSQYLAYFRSYEHVYYRPQDSDLESLLENRVRFIVIMTLSDFQSSQYTKLLRRERILYIGTGINDQYAFTNPYRGKMFSNYAVFFYHGRNEVIQLVEGE